ncbi:MAG TPA: DMT family transporter [Candidatus Dormibacteraeota bacterium]|nr:DMT family transporter [Candidatus Dormibacteraeota bacterium]
MVIVSAAAFAANSILAKLAYAAGFHVFQLLAIRFVLGAFGMWGIALLLGQNPLRFGRRRLLQLFALGLFVYTGQSTAYFLALQTLPASLCVLIVYIYPSLTVVAAWLFFRRAITRWHLVALVSSFLGIALLLGGARFTLAWALVFAIAAPVIYTAYILVGEKVMAGIPAAGASAVIFTGAALAFTVLATFTGEAALPNGTRGWAVALAIAVIPTMLAISLLMAGLPRVGASRAALLSTIEPVVTVLLAAVVLGERLSAVQAFGGVLVVLAVVVVQAAHLWGAEPQPVPK